MKGRGVVHKDFRFGAGSFRLNTAPGWRVGSQLQCLSRSCRWRSNEDSQPRWRVMDVKQKNPVSSQHVRKLRWPTSCVRTNLSNQPGPRISTGSRRATRLLVTSAPTPPRAVHVHMNALQLKMYLIFLCLFAVVKLATLNR